MNVKSKDTHNIGDINNVCVVIKEISENQCHTGFFFQDSNNNIKFLHLAWYEHLMYEKPDENYKWLDIPFDEHNQMHFQLFLETIYKQNENKIPYGIAIDGINFGPQGELVKEEHSGLTCATFVIRALHSQGYKIIDLDNWIIQPEDKEWQEKIVSHLDSYHKTSKEFIEHQKTYIGNVARYKPSQVVVAANSENPPLPQESILELADQLINEYLKK